MEATQNILLFLSLEDTCWNLSGASRSIGHYQNHLQTHKFLHNLRNPPNKKANAFFP